MKLLFMILIASALGAQEMDLKKVEKQVQGFYPDPVIEKFEIPKAVRLVSQLQVIRVFRRADMAADPIVPGYFVVDKDSKALRASDATPLFADHFSKNPKLDKVEFAKQVAYTLSLSGRSNVWFWPDSKVPESIEKTFGRYNVPVKVGEVPGSPHLEEVTVVVVETDVIRRAFGRPQSAEQEISLVRFIFRFEGEKFSLFSKDVLYPQEPSPVRN
jgi:hypothetical protein